MTLNFRPPPPPPTYWVAAADHPCCSGEEDAHSALDGASTDGALSQRGGAVFADDQMATGNEHDGHLSVHTHFTRSFLLKFPQLFFHW